MAQWTQCIARLWQHRWAEGQVGHSFPPEVLLRLERQVRASEAQHTGQVQLCVEGGLPYSYIWRGASARERAVGLFGKLRTWDTEHNNGVLIYLLMAEHAMEIVADRALARAVPQSTWDAVMAEMGEAFQRGAFTEGMEQALAQVSALLATHFPRDAQTPAGDNSLPDAPVVQGRFFKDR